MFDARLRFVPMFAAAAGLFAALFGPPAFADTSRLLGDWTASCWTAQNRCATETDPFPRSERGPVRLTLSIGRDDGANTGWEVGFRLRRGAPASDARFALTMDDGDTFIFEPGDYATRSDRFVQFAGGDELTPLLEALRQGRRVELTLSSAGRGDSRAGFSLRGLDSALDWLDRQQGRVGSSGLIAEVETMAPAEETAKPQEEAAAPEEMVEAPEEPVEPEPMTEAPPEEPVEPEPVAEAPPEEPVEAEPMAEAQPEEPVETPEPAPAPQKEAMAPPPEEPAEPEQEEAAAPPEEPAEPQQQAAVPPPDSAEQEADTGKTTPETGPEAEGPGQKPPEKAVSVPAPILARHHAKSACEPLNGGLLDPRLTGAAALSENKMLYIIPCFAGAYNVAYRLYVVRNEDVSTMRTLYFANYSRSLGWYGSDTLINVSYEPESGILRAFGKGRGPGDCGNAAVYRWANFDFKMLEYRAWDHCDRSRPPERWPVIYRAADAKSPAALLPPGPSQ